MSNLAELNVQCYILGVSKEMVLENTQHVLRSNRPDSAVLSCPNSVESFGQDGQKGNLRRTASTSVFNILPTTVLENAEVDISLVLGARHA